MKKSVLPLMLANLFLICGCGASLVFVSDRDGRDQIYSMAGNGFNQQNLSNNSAYEHFPDISPDATKIVFSSFRSRTRLAHTAWTNIRMMASKPVRP